MYDFEGLGREVHREKRNIYLEPESYMLLDTAKTTSEIIKKADSNDQKYVYVTLEKYKERIAREKEAERCRKDRIWAMCDEAEE